MPESFVILELPMAQEHQEGRCVLLALIILFAERLD